MAEIPVSNAELEDIVTEVAHELYAKWAVEGRFPEDKMSEYAELAIDDVVFVVSLYMDKINSLFSNARAEELLIPKSSLIVN